MWLDEQVVLAACSDGGIRFWDIESCSSGGSKILRTLHVDAEVRDMELSVLFSGRRVLTVAAGKTVSFFDLAGECPLLHAHPMPVHFRDEGGASLHPSGQKFIAGGSDLWVRVFDFSTGKQLECHKVRRVIDWVAEKWIAHNVVSLRLFLNL